MTRNDEIYLARCLELAKNGYGHAFPNPLVGCVIVHEGEIIGEGFHFQPGEGHAEVRAIQSVKNKELLKDATLYVNLEPCSHYGKTPPCTDLIIDKQIPTIVIGTLDPSPKVAGKGVEKLFQNGHQVTVGVLEEACAQLNKRFFTAHQNNRPYVVLKWAQSTDAYFAPNRQDPEQPFWISNAYAKQLTHKYRAAETAILTGKTTALKDNPSLTTREWAGDSPLRVYIDPKLELPEHYALNNREVPTLVFCQKGAKNHHNRIHEEIDFEQRLPAQILEKLQSREIQSVLIEGGSHTLQSFIDSGLWDEARVFTGDRELKHGLKAPALPVEPRIEKQVTNNQLNIYYNDHKHSL